MALSTSRVSKISLKYSGEKPTKRWLTINPTKFQLYHIKGYKVQLELFDSAMTLKYCQGHWKKNELVKLHQWYHTTKFDISQIYTVKPAFSGPSDEGTPAILEHVLLGTDGFLTVKPCDEGTPVERGQWTGKSQNCPSVTWREGTVCKLSIPFQSVFLLT